MMQNQEYQAETDTAHGYKNPTEQDLTRDYILCMLKELRDLAQAVGLHDLSRALTQAGYLQFKD